MKLQDSAEKQRHYIFMITLLYTDKLSDRFKFCYDIRFHLSRWMTISSDDQFFLNPFRQSDRVLHGNDLSISCLSNITYPLNSLKFNIFDMIEQNPPQNNFLSWVPSGTETLVSGDENFLGQCAATSPVDNLSMARLESSTIEDTFIVTSPMEEFQTWDMHWPKAHPRDMVVSEGSKSEKRKANNVSARKYRKKRKEEYQKIREKCAFLESHNAILHESLKQSMDKIRELEKQLAGKRLPSLKGIRTASVHELLKPCAHNT